MYLLLYDVIWSGGDSSNVMSVRAPVTRIHSDNDGALQPCIKENVFERLPDHRANLAIWADHLRSAPASDGGSLKINDLHEYLADAGLRDGQEEETVQKEGQIHGKHQFAVRHWAREARGVHESVEKEEEEG